MKITQQQLKKILDAICESKSEYPMGKDTFYEEYLVREYDLPASITI